jgi:hypothetical protein
MGYFPPLDYHSTRLQAERQSRVRAILDREKLLPTPDQDIIDISQELLDQLFIGDTSQMSPPTFSLDRPFIPQLGSLIRDLEMQEIYSQPLKRLNSNIAPDVDREGSSNSIDGFDGSISKSSKLTEYQTYTATFTPAKPSHHTTTQEDDIAEAFPSRKKRKTPRTKGVVDRRGQDVETNPQAADGLSYRERTNLIRGIKGWIETVRKCYNRAVVLPPFNPTNVSNVATFYAEVWDWVDTCQTQLEDQYGKMEYDFSSLESVLQDISRPRRVYGEDYRQCQELLDRRSRR